MGVFLGLLRVGTKCKSMYFEWEYFSDFFVLQRTKRGREREKERQRERERERELQKGCAHVQCTVLIYVYVKTTNATKGQSFVLWMLKFLQQIIFIFISLFCCFEEVWWTPYIINE